MKDKQNLIDFIYTPDGKARAPRFKESLLVSNGFGEVLTNIKDSCVSVGLVDVSLTDMIRAYCKDQMFVPHCKICGTKYIKWSNKHQSWSKYCSQTCVQNDPEVKSKNKYDYSKSIVKRHQTMQERYGVISMSQMDESKEAFAIKTKDAWSDPIRKESRLSKRIETNQERYGVDHVSQHAETSKKMVPAIKESKRNQSSEHKQMIVQRFRETTIAPDAFGILESYDQMYDLYIEKKTSILGISKFIGCAEGTVMYAMNKHQIPYDPNRQQSQVSIAELELLEFVRNIVPDVIHTYKDRKHLDIYIPERKLGIEFNGVYWHSEAKKDRYYHSDKVSYFYARDIRYIQVWEDDWINRPEVVKNFIRNLLGVNKRIGARKTSIVELTQKEFNLFMDATHMQGTTTTSTRYGLMCDGRVVAAMGFKRLPESTNGYDLCRFANINVTGAFRKLFDRFLNDYRPEQITSFGDLEILDKRSNVYLANGFLEDSILQPDYRYYDYRTKKREHKFGYRKSYFKRLGYSIDGITEKALALNHGLLRCYDSGKIRYVWNAQ